MVRATQDDGGVERRGDGRLYATPHVERRLGFRDLAPDVSFQAPNLKKALLSPTGLLEAAAH